MPHLSNFPNFWDNVEKKDISECWIWTGKTNPKEGYGVFSYNGQKSYAHRIAYLLKKGEIPSGKFVCHDCDNRVCVNPNHLYIGDNSSNMKDRQARNPLYRDSNELGRISQLRTGKRYPHHENCMCPFHGGHDR